MGSWPSKAADHSDSTLILWIRSCGGWVHSNIEIREGDKGERAVFIREGVGPIRAGSDLFRIPLNLLLTLERAKRETSLGSQFFKSLNAKSHAQDHTILACWILQERLQGKKSFWHPYISSLPKNPPGLSLLHGALTQDDDAKRRINIDDELRGTLAGKEVKAFAEIIHDDFKSLCSEDEIFKQNINLKDFVWARFMVSSRVFRLDWESMAAVSSSSNEEGATMLTMVPLADMLNHSEDHNCDWRFMKSRLAKTAHFRMTAREGGIGSGVEACDTYGKKPNHIFLAHYGFALPKNRRDMAEIVIHLSQDGVDMKTRNCENKESCLATTTKKENNKFYDNLRKRMMHHKREMSGLLTLSGGEHEESENVEVASRRIRQQIRNSSMEGSVITQPASNNLADILTFLRLEVASSEKLEEISGIKTLKELLTCEEKNRLGGDYSSLAKQVRVVKPLGIREEKLVLKRFCCCLRSVLNNNRHSSCDGNLDFLSRQFCAVARASERFILREHLNFFSGIENILMLSRKDAKASLDEISNSTQVYGRLVENYIVRELIPLLSE